MVKKIFYINFFILALCFLSVRARAQIEMQVVEKRIEKEFSFSAKETLKIVGEKAVIKVNGWESNKIKLIMKFTTKNVKKAVAERELDYIKYNWNREDNVLEIQNTFIVPPDISQIKSQLLVEFELWVPNKSKISISNKVGDVSVKDLGGDLQVSLELGNLELKNISGNSKVQISYGDIIGTGIQDNFYCKSRNAQINLRNIEGSYTFRSAYGGIDLSCSKKLLKLDAESSGTRVDLSLRDVESYNYKLATSYSDIKIQGEQLNKFLKKSASEATLNLNSKPSNSLIKIKTSYSPITINSL